MDIEIVQHDAILVADPFLTRQNNCRSLALPQLATRAAKADWPFQWCQIISYKFYDVFCA